MQTVGQSRADSGVILMVTRALDLYSLAVQKKSFGGVEVN
jgi:hypothetical protein